MNSYTEMESLRKKKKSKKEKKSKNHKSYEKAKKKKRMSSSDSDSESTEMEWVEVTAETKKPEVQREDWMCQETFVPTISKEEILAKDSNYRRKHKDQEQTLYKPGQHERELNPYWKNDGKGVPEDSPLEIKLSSSLVNDGGLSHLKRSYKRIEQQAEEEGRTMEEVAVERWGSLDKLKSLIAEAEERLNTKTRHSDRHKDCHDKKRDYVHEPKWDSSHRKHGRSTETRYERKHHTETTYSKNMFKRPSQEYAEEDQESRHSSRSSHESAWKKKKLSVEPHIEAHRSSKESAYDRNMFKRPSQESIEEQHEPCRTRQNSHQPAWMKKKPSQELPISDKNARGESSLMSADSYDFKKNLAIEETTEVTTSEESVSMTDNEMNNLAAKILKAEMRGDLELAAQLQFNLDTARDARKSGISAITNAEKRRGEKVILSKVDSHGIARPLATPDYPVHSSKKKGHSKDKMSKVKSYFSEESEHSLKKMFEREKLITTDDQIEMFVDAELENRGLTDQDYEIGDISAKVAKKMGQQRQDERDYNRAIQEHKRRNTALEKCEYCFEKMKKHLIISDSQQAYLCLPSYQSLTEDHCLIVPKAHVSSSLLLDEDVAEEIKNLKKSLVNMFQEHKKCVAFVETSTNLKYSPHLVIECFPMPLEVGDTAPMYFKKAIQEHGSEWSDNKKLVDLFKKDLKHSVPKGLPFFAVEFSQGGGYAHVVEDRDFPRHFGKEIIGGMLEIDYHLCSRYKREDFKEHSKKVLKFTNMWKSYTN